MIWYCPIGQCPDATGRSATCWGATS